MLSQLIQDCKSCGHHSDQQGVMYHYHHRTDSPRYFMTGAITYQNKEGGSFIDRDYRLCAYQQNESFPGSYNPVSQNTLIF